MTSAGGVSEINPDDGAVRMQQSDVLRNQTRIVAIHVAEREGSDIDSTVRRPGGRGATKPIWNSATAAVSRSVLMMHDIIKRDAVVTPALQEGQLTVGGRHQEGEACVGEVGIQQYRVVRCIA